MPKLQDFRQAKKITLPSFPDSIIEIYNSVLVADAMKLDANDKNEVQIGIASLPYFIKSWNFTDEKETILSINVENLGFLNVDDLTFLVNSIKDFVLESKKK